MVVGNRGGGGIPPLPPSEASGLWKQHPPIVTRLESWIWVGMGQGLDVGRQEEEEGDFFSLFLGRGGGGEEVLAARQPGSPCSDRGPPSVVGGGVD